MHIFAGYYDLKKFINEETLQLIKDPRVYSLDEFLALENIKALEEDALTGERIQRSWSGLPAKEKALAIKEHLGAASGYCVEIFENKADALTRLEKEHELREWSEDNYMFAYLEVIDGKAYEIWLRPLMDD